MQLIKCYICVKVSLSQAGTTPRKVSRKKTARCPGSATHHSAPISTV